MYVTVAVPNRTHQVSIEEFLREDFAFVDNARRDIPYTRTCEMPYIPYYLRAATPLNAMIRKLYEVDELGKQFDVNNMSKYYRHYTIPKKSGKPRPIDEPNDYLKAYIKEFRTFLEKCGAKWHTSAYAYVPKRSIRDERECHKARGSRWFEYLDFHNFFGSFTFDYAWNVMQNLYPFCMICESSEENKKKLERCLRLCFLNNGLPQGTTVSPMLTNLLMIPFDFEISRKLAHCDSSQPFYYTRYADDICVSARDKFNPQYIENIIRDFLKEHNCPFVLNTDKTHFNSISGRNYHLGLCYNAAGNITVGYRKKDSIKAQLTNFALDTKHGTEWPLHDVQVLMGNLNFCIQQEPEYFRYVVKHLSEKFGIDIVGAMKQKLRNG